MVIFFLTEMKNVIVINSSEHINLLITPIAGISKEQASKLNILPQLFSPDILWDLAYEIHTEVIEYNGGKFLDLNAGDYIRGTLEDIIPKCKLSSEKEKRH